MMLSLYLAWQLPAHAEETILSQETQKAEEDASMFPLIVETRIPMGRDGYSPSGKSSTYSQPSSDMVQGVKPQWVHHDESSPSQDAFKPTSEITTPATASASPTSKKIPTKQSRKLSKSNKIQHPSHEAHMVVPEAKPAVKLSSLAGYPTEAPSSHAYGQTASRRPVSYTSLEVGGYGESMSGEPTVDTQNAVFEQDDAWLTNNPTKEASLSHSSSYRPPAIKPVYHTTVHDEGGEPMFQRPARPPIFERGYLTLNRPWLPSEIPSDWPGPQHLP
ncbi:MAG: hypothetical protein ACKO37_08495 [Vampirovibrionales bacterium]